MGNLTYLILALAGMVCFARAQAIRIRKEFINGNLKFTWTNVSLRSNDIQIINDGQESDWMQTTDDEYTVEDVWKYTSVTILVREFTTPNYTDYNSTYTVSRIESQQGEGESKILLWTAEFFPRSGLYNIYHFNDDTSDIVMRVDSNRATTSKPLKYVYHTRPYNSTNIIFEIRNITLMDAGYYGGGAIPTDARSGQGVILVVKGKPTKPEITGNLNVIENSEAILTCASNSTSRPSYYSKTVSFNYTWFINDTVLTSEFRKTLRIQRITRHKRFNKYSCQTKETIQSDKSDYIQINVWYGPSSVIIRPPLPVNQLLSVKDGDYIGPYQCSADCNPPCSIQWKYKLSNGTFIDAESDGETLQTQRVLNNQVLFRCMGKSSLDKQFHTALNFDVILSFGPNLSKNTQTTTIVITILSILLVLSLATIVGKVLGKRLKRQLGHKQSQPTDESNATVNNTQKQQQPDRTSELMLNEYEKINAATDEHNYDKVGAKSKDKATRGCACCYPIVCKRLKRRLGHKQSQPEDESNAPINNTQEQQQPDGTSEFMLNEYEKINAATDELNYDKVDAKSKDKATKGGVCCYPIICE